jgi:hypothetical protein
MNFVKAMFHVESGMILGNRLGEHSFKTFSLGIGSSTR